MIWYEENLLWIIVVSALSVCIVFLILVLFQKKQHEKKLDDAHKRARLMLDTIPLACFLWNKDLVLFDCNDETLRLFKIKDRQELIDRFFELSDERQGDGRLSREAAYMYLKWAFDKGECIFEWRHRLLDGTPLPVIATMSKVDYNGEDVIFVYLQDMRQHSTMTDLIDRHNSLLEMVNEVSSILLEPGLSGFESGLYKALGIMAKAVNADRVYIWKNRTEDGRLFGTQIYEWSEGAEPQQNTEYTVNIAYDEKIPTWKNILLEGKCINDLVRNFPATEQEQLTPQGILSIFIVPIFLQEQFWGFVGFDDCRSERLFTEYEELIMRSVGRMTANALIRNDITLDILSTTNKLENAVKKANEANREKTLTLKTLENILNSIDALIYVNNPETGELLFVNDKLKKIFGLENQNVIGQYCYKLFRGGQDKICEFCPCYQLEKEPYKTIVWEEYFKETNQYIRHSDCFIDWPDGSKVHLQYADFVTELKIAKDLAEQNSRAKSNFLSNMSHEMRTPMNAIIGMTSIGMSTADTERMMYCFAKINDASKHLLGVINDILDMSKIEANKFELSSVSFEFEKMLRRIIDVITFRVDERRQKLNVNISSNLPHAFTGDEQRLSQVIANLLSNAVKFTPEEGTITIDAGLLPQKENKESGECCLQVSIRDTGIGITEEQMSRLFNSFEQAEAGTSRKFGGTGLGLVISKRIVEMMGGEIWAESEPDKGSVFTFTVMLKPDTGKPKAPPEETEDQKNKYTSTPDMIKEKVKVYDDFTGKTILLAEDIEINREILLALLEPTHLNIECAENGIQALDMFRAAPEKYDMIFMDIQMPEMDGYEATRQIRSFNIPKAKTIPIIAMTANVFREDVEKCIAAGMDAHVGKPLDIEEVSMMLRKYFNAR